MFRGYYTAFLLLHIMVLKGFKSVSMRIYIFTGFLIDAFWPSFLKKTQIK